MGHKSVIMVKIFIKGQSQRGMGMDTTVSKINTYSDNSALELTQYKYTQVLKIWFDSDLCQRILKTGVQLH